MTLDEKIGQLVQRAGGRSKSLNSKLDDAELENVRAGRVGSYLHVAGAEPLARLQQVAVKESRLGIPLLFAMDVVHGYRTIFPVPLAVSSTWSPESAELMARVSAEEATAAGLHWTFAPMVDVARDARWGRIVEGAGEDPYLGSQMAVAQVHGYQLDDLRRPDTLLASTKHFGAYSAVIGGRDYNTADISERTLQEVYLPPF
jgi:beta-glucosidase